METIPIPQIVTTRRLVPNLFPVDEPTTARIALIGDAPSEQDENYRSPFVGKSGSLLNGIFYEVGINRNQCFLGNLCQSRPPANRLAALDWDGPEIQSGITQLIHDLQTFNPTIVVGLGNAPLHFLKRGSANPGRQGADFKFPENISKWRGSLFTSPTLSVKAITTLHPAFVLREFSGFPLLKFDLKRAKEEAGTRELVLPQRELSVGSASELCYIMDHWESGRRCSLDIEGGLPTSVVHPNELIKNNKRPKDNRRSYGWPCVSICGRPSKSITIAWGRLNEQEHLRVLRSFANLMYRRDVPKVLQNQLYDNFVLSFGYGIPIRNVTEDVMIKGWEIFAELPRGLATQASIWTRQPHWKDDSMYEGTADGLFLGCALDSAVTLEICQAQDGVLEGASRKHYDTTIQLQMPFLYMELRGILYDQKNVTEMLRKTNKKLAALGKFLENRAGEKLRGPAGSLSSKKLTEYLYLRGGYPAQYKKEGGRKTEKLTADNEALLRLKRGRESDRFLSNILRHRHFEGIRETLQITADADERVRCGYSLEAETGRVKCYTSPTGSGANLQTIQKTLRGNYRADEGFDFFQCDLEGADGWTVASHCKKLGDPTMFDDYKAGMKPAKIIALMYWFGAEINQLDRDSLKFAHDSLFPIVKKLVGEWLYLGCKRVQHGSNYLMGIPTMQLNVLRDSYKESGKPVYMEASDAKRLQDCYFTRYPGVKSWHNWATSKLVADGKLTSASGNTRLFFGRRFGDGLNDTVKEFLAHEPQNNTTWATNLAMLQLWSDPENRRPDGSLIIEPLHQVHDALCGQWPQEVRDWARAKVRTYFNNVISIAGTELVIPFDGGWGESWGNCYNPL